VIGKSGLATLLAVLCVWEIGIGQDYLRLENGQVVRGAIVRSDSATIFLAAWDERHLLLPHLQVFSKEEIESIWFRPPPIQPEGWYRPRERGYEFGGGITFENIKEPDVTIRRVLQLSLLGGYTVLPVVGIEAEADFTFPHGERSDTTWHRLRTGYQVAFNLLAHPIQVWGVTPFALLGGGTAIAIPVGHTILTELRDSRNLLNLGAGLKWGRGGIGCRLEYRYQFYTWTPDEFIPIYDNEGNRTGERRADAREAFSHLVRLGLFFYR
jgi:hypothetical protein